MPDKTADLALTTPPAGLLAFIATRRRGDPFDAAAAALRRLHCEHPQRSTGDSDGFGADGETPRQVYLAWSDQDGEEVAAAYLAADAAGRLCTATLAWGLGVASTGTAQGFDREAAWLIGQLAEILGPPLGILSEVSEGLSASGDADVIVARAFWSAGLAAPDGVAQTYRGRGEYRAFHDAQAAAPEALTLWLMADTLQAGGTLSAMFTPFMAD